MLDHCNSYHRAINHSKKDEVRKSSHQCSSSLTPDKHPSSGHGGYSKNMTFKFVKEIITQIRGSFVVVIPDLGKFGFDSRVILNLHCRNRCIN